MVSYDQIGKAHTWAKIEPEEKYGVRFTVRCIHCGHRGYQRWHSPEHRWSNVIYISRECKE